jgi:hypothetical protein
MKLKSFYTIKVMISKLKRLPTEWEKKSLLALYLTRDRKPEYTGS